MLFTYAFKTSNQILVITEKKTKMQILIKSKLTQATKYFFICKKNT